jgi:uncharacterized protein YdbL (DUF1318 family)
MTRLLFFISILFFNLGAQAQYKVLEMKPPAAKKHLKSQLERMDLVRKYKRTGQIGETDQATLAIREPKAIAAAELKQIKKVVDDENRDRQRIFDEIAKFNKLNKQEQGFLIKSAYETYRNTDAKGSYYLENKKWFKKD